VKFDSARQSFKLLELKFNFEIKCSCHTQHFMFSLNPLKWRATGGRYDPSPFLFPAASVHLLSKLWYPAAVEWVGSTTDVMQELLAKIHGVLLAQLTELTHLWLQAD